MSLTRRLSRATQGITFQLVLLLSLAVTPIGVISVSQSLGFVRETKRSAEKLLLSLTEENIAVEHRLMETGFSAVRTLIADVVAKHTTPDICSTLLADFIAAQSLFTSVRFVDIDGVSHCASSGPAQDYSKNADFLRFLKDPVSAVDRLNPDQTGRGPVLRLTEPVRENGTLLGYLSLAVPFIQLGPLPNESGVPRPTEVIVFNAAGDVLASTREASTAADRLPTEVKVMGMLNAPDAVFDGADISGVASSFAKVTLISGAVTAIGVWPRDNPITLTNGVLSNALIFPMLMWVVSLAATFFAARRLVIRPIQYLRSEMRNFTSGQRNPPTALPPGAALEIQEAASTFSDLAKIVTRNESALVVIAETKLLLLREVHHRIKNNLQMISSIISIQRRKTTDPEVRQVMLSLQDRVLSIAAVDQSLYLNGDVWDVQADKLIASITARLINVKLEPGHAVDITTAYDDVLLQADQIGPLSLLANEAVTNALKYVGVPQGGRAFVHISLKRQDDSVVFMVVNSIAPGSQSRTPTAESTSLGVPLIQAFSDQLAADYQSGPNEADQSFRLSVRFHPSRLAAVEPPVDAAA